MLILGEITERNLSETKSAGKVVFRELKDKCFAYSTAGGSGKLDDKNKDDYIVKLQE
jgi:hypothetical protein